MAAGELVRLESALEQGKRARSWHRLTLRRYLETAGIAYDAAIPELRSLTPRKKYERKADTRHGGLLDLRPVDPRAFEALVSGPGLGGRPSVGDRLRPPARNPAVAPPRCGRVALLPERRYPRPLSRRRADGDRARRGRRAVRLDRAAEVIAALRGDDWVEVGPFRGQLALEDLEERRLGATSRVVWTILPGSCLRRREPAARPACPGSSAMRRPRTAASAGSGNTTALGFLSPGYSPASTTSTSTPASVSRRPRLPANFSTYPRPRTSLFSARSPAGASSTSTSTVTRR